MARNDLFSLWFETAAAMNAAALTIVSRSMKLQQAWLSGDMTGGPEASRMVIEKIAAAQAGALRAGFAMASIAINPARSEAGRRAKATAVIAAAARPGFRKARANARRLTRVR
jgi:hypothetical protein